MILKQKNTLLLFLTLLYCSIGSAQIGTTFWFAAPEVTDQHDSGNLEQQIRVATFATPATVRIYQPANPAGLDTTVTVAANSLVSVETTPFQELIETKPFDQVVSTGILIESSAIITAYYEVATSNNPDIFALKADNALGTEFYLPLLNVYNNNVFNTTRAFAQFNIVATEDNTTIFIFPSTDILNHNEREPYSITLNRGETYSGRAIDEVAATKPTGTVISSDKPIAVTYADDSVRPTSCFDLYGDQLVPTNIIGNEYIVNSNASNLFNDVEEHVVIVATENFTTVEKNGVVETVLFAGQTYVDVINTTTFYSADNPIYLIQVTGFGCELGSAILPPLNCAGSDQVSFARSPRTNQRFFLSLLTRTGNEGNFDLNGDASLISAADFTVVPGTNGEWVSSLKEFSLTQVPAGSVNLMTNSTGLFSLGIINGNTNGGTRYGYFSLFQANVTVDAGSNFSECSGNDVDLSGTVSGGAITGKWSVLNGAGSFVDDESLTTIYNPTQADYIQGNLQFVLESTGGFCSVEYDTVQVSFTPGPTIDAGDAQTICANNANITLDATTTIASGVIWSGGTTTGFSPSIISDPVTYTPTNAEITTGTLKLFATTTGVGTCEPITDSVEISFVVAPIVEAGSALNSCANNESVVLDGSVTNFTGFGQGIWSGGGATVNPTDNALTGVYTPTATEITNKIANLTLTSINNGICSAASDNVILTITDAPTVEAGTDQVICANNSEITLDGSFTIATGATWIGGLGTFTPNRNTTNAVYTPTIGEISSGTLTLTLETTGNGTCNPESDQLLITFTDAPTSVTSIDQTICANNSDAAVTVVQTIALSVTWSGGLGTYLPNNTSNNITYQPTATEIAAGEVELFATTADNGTCNSVVDSTTITIIPSPIVEAGSPLTSCENNPDINLAGSVITNTGFGEGNWTGGAGFVSPSNNALTGIYTPTATEIFNKTANLILTSTNNGLCNAESDNVTLTIADGPTVDAGGDQVICANNSDITLNGSVTIATGGSWTGGVGTFTPNRNTLNATYTPTVGEIASGTLTLTLETTGNGICNTVSDQLLITFTNAPTITTSIDQTICANNSDVVLTATQTITPSILWSGGLGIYLPNNTSNNITYQPTATEIASGTIELFATTTDNATCNAVSDSTTVTIIDAPIVEAGTQLTSCENNPEVNLGGSVITSTGFGEGNWSGGAGFVSPSSNALTGIYTPTTTEISNGTVNLILTSTNNGLCNSESDNVTLSIIDGPTVNAGSDQVICANNSEVTLNGAVTIATGGTWTGGSGTFTPNRNTLNATYSPTVGEVSSGTLTLTLETTGNGICNNESDQLLITFTDAPTIITSIDQTICANNSDVALTATQTIASSILWSGGLGTYLPNNTTNNITYQPTATEIASGSVELFATTTDNGTCNSVSDSTTVTVTDAPIVEAGSALTSCENNPEVNLGGSVITSTGFGEGTWTGGAGFVSPSNNALTGIYTPTTTEISNGTVNLILTSTNNGLCDSESDNVNLTITDAPTVDAGSDQTICANNTDITLNGAVTIATGGSWTGGVGTFTPNRNSLNAIYTPTVGEIALGTLTLTLETTGNGICNTVSDQLLITFTNAPTITTSIDQTICANNSDVVLTATQTIAPSILWSGGLGTYLPNNTSNNITYQPTAAEISSGTIELFATTTDNATCNAVSDSTTVTIIDAPIVEAGTPLTSCENNPEVNLGGNVITSTGFGEGIWTGGAGFVNPSNNALTGIYTPTTTEISNGTVNLILTSTNNGLCNAESDNVTLTITDAPTVDAGSNQVICANNTEITLNGSVTIATGGTWTGGAGTFNPNRNTLNAIYSPTVGEIALGTLTLTLETTGNGICNNESDQLLITFTDAPTLITSIDQTICANNSDVALTATQTIASSILWSGGLGTYLPSNTSNNITYQPTATEISNGTVELFATTADNGTCNSVSDSTTVTIIDAPIVEAGTSLTSCENNPEVNLGGSVITSTGFGEGNWTGGTGFVSPSNNALTGIYTPTTTEISNGTVNLILTSTNNGLCNSESDNVTLTIIDGPTVNSGGDQILCANNADVLLNGSFNNATGITWVGGLGTFTPDRNTPNATYTPTNDEISLGSISLLLRTTGNGTCSAVESGLTVTFTPSPTVDAGLAQTICDNNADILLAGTFGIATGIEWSGLNGTFISGSTADANSTYRPSQAEIDAGSLTAFITTTGNGSCIGEVDSVLITFTEAPTVDAGTDINICANNLTSQLNGQVTIAGGIEWTGGTGSFIPSIFDRNAEYIPSATEVANGFINLTLESRSNGNCNIVTDNVLISITPEPIVNAGVDFSVCENNPSIQLNASLTVSSGVIWSGGNGTYTPNETSLTTVYTPTDLEISNGSIEVTASSTGNGNCNIAEDDIIITFTPSPVVEAGDEQIVCANNANVLLNAQVFGSTGGTWSNFSGSFAPNPNTLNATYTPSSTEIANGQATLFLTSTGNAGCLAEMDSLIISITESPTVDAGLPQTSCANNANIDLDGTFNNAGGVTWSGGNGSFIPSINDKNSSYSPSASEISAGTVTLTLTTTDVGTCFAVSDDVIITISNAPTADAGVDQSLCANNADISLNGSSTLSSGGEWSGGFGTFTPNNLTANATYTPTTAEISTGVLTLRYSTTGNGSCNASFDELDLTFTPSPIIEAGLTQTTCANNSEVNLDGSVTIATGAIWSGGLGTFSSGNTDLNSIYTPSATEIDGGTITLTLQSTGNGNCLSVSDNVVLNFSPAPFVSAGSDIFLCVNDDEADLQGLISGGASQGEWSTTGSGSFIPSNQDITGTYRLGTSDITSRQVNLTLTSINNGDCLAESDQVSIFLTEPGNADAGSTGETICANNLELQLAGDVTGGALGGTWASTGTGTFSPVDTDLDAIYVPSDQDIAAGIVTISLTANSCDQNLSQFDVQITPAPIVSAGDDIINCANDLTIDLDGTVSGASITGQWRSTGTGNFSPDANTLTTVYNASEADSLAGSISLILEATNIGNCNPALDTLEVQFLEIGIINAGSDETLCANNSDLQLNGSVSGGANTGTWSSTGTGSFSPNATVLNAIYQPTEDDIAAGLIILTLEGNSCDMSSASLNLTLTPSPTIDIGIDRDVCENNSTTNLSSNIAVATGGVWSSSTGNGTFSSIFNQNITYTPDPQDGTEVTIFKTTTGNGTCIAVTDSFLLTITEAPLVNAGIDQFICAGINRVNLLGSVSGGASTGVWSTLGTGGFDPGNVLLETDYLVSNSDSINGTITLILTSTSNGNCLEVFDTILVNITDAGTVEAGPGDVSVCANNREVELNASISGGITVFNWETSGGGTFTPNAQSLNATYLPDATDSLNGAATITLNTNSCNGASDQINVTITPAPFVFAGVDRVTCVDDLQVTLNGIATGASSTGVWSSDGTGSFVPNDQILNGAYLASALDSEIGRVELTLEATNIGNCLPVSDALVLNITTGGTADAGSDQIVCENNAEVTLDATFTGGATALTWSTSGTGVFTPNRTTANAVYIPSSQDISDGVVNLSMESNSCDLASDNLQIIITSAPETEAGNNLSLCENNTEATLSGSVTGASGATWISNGFGGTFEPSNTSLNAIYVPSETDLLNKQVQLRLVSTGNGNCLAVADSTIITYTDAPLVNAGIDLDVCKNDSSIILDGQVSVVTTTGIWSTLGGGAFTPNNTSLSNEYLFGPVDTTNGFVDLILASTNNANCLAVTDTIRITLGETTFAFAGDSLNICNENLIAQLDGFVSGGATTGIWSTNGTGTFNPSVNDLNASYRFSAQDSLNQSVQLTLTANAANGCLPGVDTRSINILSRPLLNAGTDIIVCPGTDTITYAGSGNNIFTAQWKTLGSGTFISPESDFSGEYLLGANDITQRNVTLVISGLSEEGCQAIDDSLMITIGNPLTMGFEASNFCIGDETQFIDTTTIAFGEIVSWNWSFGDTKSSNVQNPVNTYSNVQSYDVTLVIETNQGCSDSLNQVVTINPLPIAGFRLNAEGDDPLVGEQIQFLDQSQSAAAWEWIFGLDLDTSNLQNPTFAYTEADEFELKLKVTSPEGCIDTLNDFIDVLSTEIIPPVLPNAFSPNGDNLNDEYLVRGGPFASMEFRIYNEWGNLIFDSNDPETGWDGEYKGRAQPAGAYTFTLKATTLDGLEYKRSGDLTLIR